MVEPESEIFEFEKKSTFSFAQSWQGFKNAFMGTLFVMANDMELSYTMNLLGMFIAFMQMLAFPFNQNSGFPWNPDLTNWLVILCNNAQLEFYISADNPLQNLILYLISIFLVFMNLSIIGIVGYKFIKKKAQSVFLLKILRSVTSLLTTIFFMPILSLFLLITSCALGRSTSEQGCPTDQPILLILSSLIFSILFGMVSLIVCASFYELDYKSDDASARPHARVDLMYLVVQGILTVVFKVFEQSEYHLIQISSLLGLGIPMTYFYIAYLPFYNYKVSVFQAQFVAVFTWSCLCLALALLVNDISDPGPPMLFYVGSLFIWILTKETCDWWRQKLVEKNIYTVKNPYQVELHTRYMILERAGTYKTEEEQLLNEAEDFYYQAERKFPDSSLLKIFVAQFHLTYRDRQEAIPKLEQAEKRSPALDEQFIIYKTRQNVGKDVITMVTFTSYLESSAKAEISALSYQLEFWKALALQSGINDDILISLSKNITKNIDTTLNNYKFMLSVDRTHPRMVPMYVYFMEDVLHRKDEEVENLNNRLRDMIGNQGINKVITSSKFEQQPRISISFEKSDFGRIDRVNSEMISWIGIPKAKIMNQKIETLMPYYYGQCLISFLNEIKEKWDEALGPPPIEMYFMDKDNMILGCTCNFILESDDSGAKMQARSTNESSMNIETRTTMQAKLNLTLGNIKIHEWHRPVRCVLVPHDETEKLIFISSEYIIMNYNSRASAFFGMNSEMIGVTNIKELISNFDGLFERAKKHIDMSSGMLVEFSPVQTFLISNSGTFSRIRVSINSYCVDNNIYYILAITEPGSYSKPTQKFFSLFIKFLEVYMKKGGHLGDAGEIGEDDLLGDKKKKKIERLLQKVRKEVEAKNSAKSPELESLRKLMWVFMILMMGAFGGSYAISVVSFENYLSEVHEIDILTDIRAQSSLVCTYIIMLDMARQGFGVPDSIENLIADLAYVAQNTQDKANYISSTSSISALHDNVLPCISFKYLGGYEVIYFNPINALIQQSSYALKLTERDISNFNILNNSYAFWCYFNGNKAIRNSLDGLSGLFVESAEKSRQTIAAWAYTFAAIEIGLITAVIFLSLPLILKSEELNMKIIRVFYSVSHSILLYLQDITKTSLEMRKDEHYPDNRGRYQSAEDHWEDFLIKRQSDRRESNANHQEQIVYVVTSWKKFIAFCKNPFTKRLMLFCLISAIVSWLLQTYVGVLMPTSQLNSAAMLIKNSGMISAFQSQSLTSLISEILSPLEIDAKKNADIVYEDLNSTEVFVYPDLENSFWDTLNNTSYLKMYMSMMMIGNSSLGVSFEMIHGLQISQFINFFITDQCPSYIDKCEFYYGVMPKGYLPSVSILIFDIESIAYRLYYSRNLSISDRYSLVQSDLAPLLILGYQYINLTSYEVEHAIISYFSDIVTNYNFIQKLVLIFYYIFCFSYMILIFRRTLHHHERKKKMTRSMLLLLPNRVVGFSKHIQKALENMNYD